MPWTQSGPIFVPTGDLGWSRTHAQAPSAFLLGDRIRVYFATRDKDNRSRPGFFEVEREDPTRLIRVHDQPVMDLGKPGTHDEDGVVPSHLVQVGPELRMYYGGVSRGGSVPYRMSIGLAASRDEGVTFERVFEGPIVDRTRTEPYMTMAPHLLRSEGGWTMWYGSGTGWVEVGGKFEPTYQIKSATSTDGLAWSQTGGICIPKLHSLEANTRPSVLRSDQGLDMWFCYRGSEDYRGGSGSYRIGHATSANGSDWARQPDPDGLEPGGGEWNAAMMAYPSVIEVDGRRYMFHNGNGFGVSGVGCAVWRPPVAS